MVLRFDTGTLGKAERTPQGGIRVPAALTRVGVFEYTNPDGSIRREYRPAQEVSREDSLRTLLDAPVTNLHHGLVDASNWRRVSVGGVSGQPRMDGDHVVGDLVIQDQEVIGLVESGERREVSCGYTCDLDFTPGTTPTGERYDAIQVGIQYNHVALVPRGRAGSSVALRLDAADNQLGPEGHGETMKTFEIIGNVKHEVGTDAHRAAVVARDAADKAVQERLDSISGLEGKIAALEAEKKTLQERLDAAPKDLHKAVQERLALAETAAKAGVEVREDATDADIRKAVVEKVFPSVDLAGKDDAFISPLYLAASGSLAKATGKSAAEVRADALGLNLGRPEEREDADDVPPDVKARSGMISNLRKRATDRGDVRSKA